MEDKSKEGSNKNELNDAGDTSKYNGSNCDISGDATSFSHDSFDPVTDSGSEAGASALAAAMELDLLSLREEVRESKERYLRLMAEFDNFRKQKIKERSELLKYQGEQLIVDLLEIVDTFELAQKYDSADDKQFRDGVALISRKFSELLDRWGVKGESAIGKDFDPSIHNAISQIPTHAAPAGTVVEELKKTYFYKDKVVRIGDVIVAVAPSS